MIRILIVDDIHPIFLEKMQTAGFSFDYKPDISLKEVIPIINQFDGLVIRSKFRVEKDLIEKATRLRFIARGGAGMDNIDEKSAKDKDIHLINAPDGNRNAVGEHMVGMLLAILNNLAVSHQEISKGEWLREQNRGVELRGKTVALIGYGNNGQAMAQCLQGFGVQVLAYDKYKKEFSDDYVQEATMESVFLHADILSLHIPLTSETRGLVDQDYLNQFKKPILLLNGARGEIAVIPALLEALSTGKIVGAGLDVLPVEHFPALQTESWFHELINHPKVLLSPHIAGWTKESYLKIADVLATKIIGFIASKSQI